MTPGPRSAGQENRIAGLDGRRWSSNDDGLIDYRLTFTDGSSGIFTSQVPEPSALAVASVLLPRRRQNTGLGIRTHETGTQMQLESGTEPGTVLG